MVKCTAAIFFLTVDCNSRAQPVFFCSLKLLFGDVPVAVAVVDFLNSLITLDDDAQWCTIILWYFFFRALVKQSFSVDFSYFGTAQGQRTQFKVRI